MALFGDLEHHALTDLARVLKPQTGTLFFHEAYQGHTLELTLTHGQLRALYVDGFLVREQAQVRNILRELHLQGRGAFEFQREDFPEPLPSSYVLPLVETLQEFAGASIPLDQLPHPDTRFLPAPGRLAVPPSLAAAWALFQPHLAQGASAAELARQVGQTERDVQVALHRLRAVDLIAPLRAARPQPVSVSLALETPHTADVFPASPSPATAPLVHRLLGALRRLAGTSRS
ncbi:hypothetical protein Dcar01_02750 [Deinococcus carri]|uniref:DUF4388 domain-containing protein n=1 Tax=Deinococcus carri TaxID=1211323 RepID=A0ABP9WA39_9DEIO